MIASGKCRGGLYMQPGNNQVQLQYSGVGARVRIIKLEFLVLMLCVMHLYDADWVSYYIRLNHN